MAFGTSPPKGDDDRRSTDSDRITLASASEPGSEGDEWFPEPCSTKNPEPYVIQRPFDFAAFHHSLSMLEDTHPAGYGTECTKPPGSSEESPLPPYLVSKDVSHVRAVPTHEQVGAPTESEATGPAARSSLLRRLTNSRQKRTRRHQVKLRHFGSRVFGVLHTTASHGPIHSQGIGPGTDFRGAEPPAPSLSVSISSNAMESEKALERPTTPLCTKIARSQSVRSVPPRRKPVPAVASHARAESEPMVPDPSQSSLSTMPSSEIDGALSRTSSQVPPRPPKSALRRMATRFQPSSSLTHTPFYSSRTVPSRGVHSSASSRHTGSDVPPLDSDHSDSDSGGSGDELAANNSLVLEPAPTLHDETALKPAPALRHYHTSSSSYALPPPIRLCSYAT